MYKMIDAAKRSVDERDFYILASMIAATKAKRFLEIGTFLMTVPKNLVVMFPDLEIDSVDSIETNDDAKIRHETNKVVAEGMPKVTLHTEGSDAFFANTRKKYDVVFVDGGHRYEQAKRDMDNAVTHLAVGGTILVHDVRNRQNTKANMRHSVRGAWRDFDHEEFLVFYVKTHRGMGIMQHIGKLK